MSDRRTAVAKVQVVIEVQTGSWGIECSMDQILKQSKESALGIVRLAIREKPAARIVEVCRVDVTLTSEAAR